MLQSEAGYIDARPLTANSTKFSCNARPDHTLGHSRLRWSAPRLVHVGFNSDSDRQPSKRDPALRAKSDSANRLHSSAVTFCAR